MKTKRLSLRNECLHLQSPFQLILNLFLCYLVVNLDAAFVTIHFFVVPTFLIFHVRRDGIRPSVLGGIAFMLELLLPVQLADYSVVNSDAVQGPEEPHYRKAWFLRVALRRR